MTGDDPAELIPVLEKYIQSDNFPDALFFNSIPACVTVYNYLQQIGLRIPEDIAVISTGQATNEGLESAPDALVG